MNPLTELIGSDHPAVITLIRAATQHAGWDNRPAWDNWKNTPGPWNNMPSWDNWKKR